jgi:hypothetical protein
MCEDELSGWLERSAELHSAVSQNFILLLFKRRKLGQLEISLRCRLQIGDAAELQLCATKEIASHCSFSLVPINESA